MAIEYHYAPMTGGLLVKNQEPTGLNGWAEHHKNMDDFLRLRGDGKIILLRTVTYGHVLFNGHGGQVDIYSAP